MVKKRLMLDQYYQAAKESFKRIWQNKTIWFWGLFVSSGMYFNFSGNHKEEQQPLPEGFINDVWVNYWNWILVGFLVFLFLIVVVWIISAIARSGVIKELDKKQNNKKHKLSFKGVWKIGKTDFKKILALDLWLLAIVIGILILDLILMFLAFLSNLTGLMISLGIILVLATIIFFILLAILKPLALIFLVLSNLNIKKSFIMSWGLLRGNLKEYLKLILTLFLILILGGLALMILAILGGLLLAVIFGVFGGFSGTNFPVLAVPLLVVVGGFILVVFLAMEGFLRLWKMDITIWWVKEIKGAKIEKKEKTRKKKVVKKASKPKVKSNRKIAGAKA
jgi:Na+-transporting methylmalonyl-CoA/oxaloacetate decarboxylase gamma subunit